MSSPSTFANSSAIILSNFVLTDLVDGNIAYLPKAARAQEFSAGRLMYGNYLKDYDLGTSVSNVSSEITFYYYILKQLK